MVGLVQQKLAMIFIAAIGVAAVAVVAWRGLNIEPRKTAPEVAAGAASAPAPSAPAAPQEAKPQQSAALPPKPPQDQAPAPTTPPAAAPPAAVQQPAPAPQTPGAAPEAPASQRAGASAPPTPPAPQAPGSPAAQAQPAPPAAGPPPPREAFPEFDVVRVEPTGDAVIAGRAPPQTQVALYAGDRKVGETRADANGQFVIIPAPLPAGDHLLSLRTSSPMGELASDQSVAVKVAGRAGERSVAALVAPDKPTVVLGETGAAAPGADAPAISVRSVEAGDEGAFFASGAATAGATVRLYLNNAFVANVQAAADGKWALRVERGMKSGHYDVRADMVEPASGRVLARAEVAFDYPAPAQTARATPAPATAPAPRPSEPTANQAPAIATTPQVSTGGAPQSPAPRPAAPQIAAAPPQPAPGPAAAPAPATAAAPTLPATLAQPPRPAPAGGPAAASAPAAGGAARVETQAAPRAQSAQPRVAAGGPQPPSPVQSGVAVVPEIQAVTVQRGDNLWRISRRILGKGSRYTQIYEANASQIRDPNRIWPGQVFVAPQAN